MRALLQRVTQAAVKVDGTVIGEIATGWLVLLGVSSTDSSEDISYLAEKCVNLRAFSDEQGKMNLSILDVGGQMLIISQFTLYADCRKGRRPSFTEAAPGPQAQTLYEEFCKKIQALGVSVATGKFGADMDVSLNNQGPVTILLDSKDRS